MGLGGGGGGRIVNGVTSTTLAAKGKESSRGFMGSVRRISLAERHRHSKLGGTGLTLSNLSEGQQLAPPLPISVTSPVLPPYLHPPVNYPSDYPLHLQFV